MLKEENIQTLDGVKRIYRITNDMNGNPRYVIHFLDIGLKDYEHDAISRKYFRKYTGKQFGGGFVFSSYNVPYHLNLFIMAQLEYNYPFLIKKYNFNGFDHYALSHKSYYTYGHCLKSEAIKVFIHALKEYPDVFSNM